jgi:hypothetical protein
MSMLLKRTAVREVLTLLDEALAPPPEVENSDPAATVAAAAARATWAPPGDLGRVSIWAKDTPVDALRAAVLEAAALTETTADDHRVVRPAGSTEGTPAPVTTGPVFRRLLLQPAALTTVELSLAGVALLPEGWTALAYSPSGALFRYKRGDRIADAAIAEVQSTDVLLETEEGPYRLVLPDVR